MKNILLLLFPMLLMGLLICSAQTMEISKPNSMGTTRELIQSTNPSEPETSEISDVVIVYGAVSIPVGDFGSTESYDAGYAKIGPAFGLDINLPLVPQVAWTLGINVSINKSDIGKIFEGPGMTVETGYWTSIWVLSGFRLSGTVTPAIRLNIFGELGMLVGYQPEVNYSNEYFRGTFNSAISHSLGFGFGGGVTLSDGFAFIVRYYQGKLQYLMDEGNKFDQPTACVQICAGITF